MLNQEKILEAEKLWVGKLFDNHTCISKTLFSTQSATELIQPNLPESLDLIEVDDDDNKCYCHVV